MSLYKSSAAEFIKICQEGTVADLLKDAFDRYHGHSPEKSEMTSWENSLVALAKVFEQSGFIDQGILLEYHLPLASSRVDCVITGKDEEDASHVVLIELKQWETASASLGPNEVRTLLGGTIQTVLHPCAQVESYVAYLKDSHTAFHESETPLHISGCSYLHNYHSKPADPLIAEKFSQLTTDYPLFTATQEKQLAQFLRSKVGNSGGEKIASLIEKRSYRPSKKLMQEVATSIAELPQYILLGEQRIGFDAVLCAVEDSLKNDRKWIILVRGKPGSGKSVIALKLLGSLLSKSRSAYYATGSRAFTETLKNRINSKCAPLLRYTNQFVDSEPSQLDVLIVDEAHRIRHQTTNKEGTPIGKDSQLVELFDAAKTLVLFVDDAQAVKPGEIGSAGYILSAAQHLPAIVKEIGLKAQFRCGGADNFIDWIDNLLGIRNTNVKTWIPNDNFEFKIVTTPDDLENLIQDRVKAGHTGRLTAGYCWKWSKPTSQGALVSDIVIGTFKRPWNASHYAKNLAPGILSASFWATDPNGMN